MDLNAFENLETSRLTDYILDDRATSFDCLVEEQESKLKYATATQSEEDRAYSNCTNDVDCVRVRPFDQDYRVALGSNYNLETNPPLHEPRWPKKEKNCQPVKPARMYCVQRPGLPDPLRDELERRMRAARKRPTSRTEWRQMAGIINPVTKVVPVPFKKATFKRKVKRSRRTAPIPIPDSDPVPECEAMPNMPRYPSRRREVIPNRPNRIIQQLHTTQLSQQCPDESTFATSFDLSGPDADVLDSGQVCPVNWIKIFRPRVVSNLSAANVDVLRFESMTKPLLDEDIVAQLVKGMGELQDSCTTLCGNANVVRSKNSAFADYESPETIDEILIEPTEARESREAERAWEEWENHGFYSSTTTLDSDTDLNCSTGSTDTPQEAQAAVTVLAEGIVPEAPESLPIVDDEDARVLNLLLEVAKGGGNHD